MNAFGPSTAVSGYRHVQRAPLAGVLYVAAGVMLVSALAYSSETESVIPLAILSVIFALIAAALHYLVVTDEGDQLRIAFGPLPLLGRTVRYSEIRDACPARTTVFDGWGVHWSPRGGWVWNIWGRDCVRLQLDHGVLWLGTDDVSNLVEFLRGRLKPPTAAGGR